MSRRIKLIFNPHADRGHAWDLATTLQSTIERFGGADWASTEYPGHATELAVQAAEEGYDVVAALGGDGTVHEVVNGLMRLPPERRPLLGAVPIGSGNDFCANLGLPTTPEEAILRLFQGRPQPVDIGRITDNTGHSEYWDNTIGIGFGAAVAVHAHQTPYLRGFSMYLWAVIQTILHNHTAPRMHITTDQETFELEIQYLVLCNGRREGGGFLIAPEAVPDDGAFDYALVEKVSRAMMFRLIPEVMKGTHGRFRQVRLGRFGCLRLTSEAPLAIHTDGEIYAGFASPVREIEVEILPAALQVLR